MGKDKAAFGGRVWQLLRLALVKGGAFLDLKTTAVVGRRSVHDQLRYYGEHEFSFDETPAFRFKTPSVRWQLLLPRIISCITPATADQFNDHNDDRSGGGGGGGDLRIVAYDGARSRDREETYYDDDDRDDDNGENGLECEEGVEEIDLRAEEFIKRFYAEMKLQPQLS